MNEEAPKPIEDSQSLTPRGKEGILAKVKVLVTERVLNAEARAKSLIEKARFNEAIKVIEELEKEVTEMAMSPRFSRTAKPSESVYQKGGSLDFTLKDLTEDAYKRQTLMMSLGKIKDEIATCIGQIELAVMDIEATKK